MTTTSSNPSQIAVTLRHIFVSIYRPNRFKSIDLKPHKIYVCKLITNYGLQLCPLSPPTNMADIGLFQLHCNFWEVGRKGGMPRCVFHTEFAVRVDVVIKAGSPMHHYITYGTRTANSLLNSLRIRVLSLYASIRRLFTWIDLQCASNFGF